MLVRSLAGMHSKLISKLQCIKRSCGATITDPLLLEFDHAGKPGGNGCADGKSGRQHRKMQAVRDHD